MISKDSKVKNKSVENIKGVLFYKDFFGKDKEELEEEKRESDRAEKEREKNRMRGWEKI
jgi:hypothetical protein